MITLGIYEALALTEVRQYGTLNVAIQLKYETIYVHRTITYTVCLTVRLANSSRPANDLP